MVLFLFLKDTGEAVDQILADEQVDSLTTPGEVLWPLTDNLGTVRDLAAYDDTTGITAIANHLTYNAFGQTTTAQGGMTRSLDGS